MCGLSMVECDYRVHTIILSHIHSFTSLLFHISTLSHPRARAIALISMHFATYINSYVACVFVAEAYGLRTEHII